MELDRSLDDEATTHDSRPVVRFFDNAVAFKWVAAAGALSAAVAPAVMATADGPTLRASISDYWDVEPPSLFWAPFVVAAVLLAVDGILSYTTPNQHEFGRRWYNIVLGGALLGLTLLNTDDQPLLHFLSASLFFGLFIAVIAYTSFLGWTGRHIAGGAEHNMEVERAGAKVSLVFLALLAITFVAYRLTWISFFFFEVFALVNFALQYVQGSIRAFPYAHYEFKNDGLNKFFRRLRIMRRPN